MLTERFLLIVLSGFISLLASSNCWLHPVTGSDEFQEVLGLTELTEEEFEELSLALLSSTTTAGGDSNASVADKIVIYNAGLRDGNSIGGMTGADSLCASSGNKPAGVSTVYAFMGFTSREIKSIPGAPTTLPVQGPGGIQIASNFNALFTNGVDVKLNDANVTDGSVSARWLSGAGSTGDSDAENCNDWTGGGLATLGKLDDDSGTYWLNEDNDPPNCSVTAYMLCIAW